MALKQRVATPFGGFGYHKHYVEDKTKYTVLSIDLLSKEEKEQARAKVKMLISQEDAMRQTGEGWTYEILDRLGRVGVMKRKGVEVALLLKRQITEVEPGPGDPAPEYALTDMMDVWQRLDIIGPSAKRSNFFIKREVDELRETKKLLGERVENLVKLADDWEIAAGKALQIVEQLQERIKKEIYPADKIIVRRAGFRYLTAEHAKKIRARLAKKNKKKGKKP